MYRIRAALKNESTRLAAQRWRSRTWWAEIAVFRMAAFHSSPDEGSSISLTTMSTMPFRISSLLAT